MLFGNTVMELATAKERCACIEPTMIAVHKEVNRRRAEKDPDAPRAYLQDMKVVGAVWNDLVESQVFAIQCGNLGTVGFATEYPDKPPDGYVDEQDMLDVNNPSVPKPRPLTDTDRQRIAVVNERVLPRIRAERAERKRVEEEEAAVRAESICTKWGSEIEAARTELKKAAIERRKLAKKFVLEVGKEDPFDRVFPPLSFLFGITVYDFYDDQDSFWSTEEQELEYALGGTLHV